MSQEKYLPMNKIFEFSLYSSEQSKTVPNCSFMRMLDMYSSTLYHEGLRDPIFVIANYTVYQAIVPIQRCFIDRLIY